MNLNFLTFLCLAALLGSSLASGDLGDVEQKVTKLSDEEIAKYFTVQTVTGRDVEQGQCSQRVQEFRKKAAEDVSEKDLSKFKCRLIEQ